MARTFEPTIPWIVTDIGGVKQYMDMLTVRYTGSFIKIDVNIASYLVINVCVNLNGSPSTQLTFLPEW